MRNIRITLEYDGTRYNGWQWQPQGVTIQETLERAAGTVVNHAVKIIGSGRTDAGVHALNQVANFKADSTVPVYNLWRGINRLLPADIVVKELVEADEEFHARYNAKSKVYAYYILNGNIRSPVFDRFSWHVRGHLDIDAMIRAARILNGTHDFSSFCASGGDAIGHIRTVTEASVAPCAHGMIRFLIEADGVLRYMVRNVVGTLVDAGYGKIAPEDFEGILLSKDRSKAGMTAPPKGLFLKEVKYR